MSNKKKNAVKILLAVLSCGASVPPSSYAQANIMNQQMNNVHDATLMKPMVMKPMVMQPMVTNQFSLPGPTPKTNAKGKNTPNKKENLLSKKRKLIGNTTFAVFTFTGLAVWAGSRFGIFGKKYTIDDLKRVYKDLYDKELEQYKLGVVGESDKDLNNEINKLKEDKNKITEYLKSENNAHINEEINKLENPSDDEEHKKNEDRLIAWVVSRIEKRKIEVIYDAQRWGYTIGGLNGITPTVMDTDFYRVEKHLVIYNNSERYFNFVIRKENWSLEACYLTDGSDNLGTLIYNELFFNQEDFNKDRNKKLEEDKINNFCKSLNSSYCLDGIGHGTYVEPCRYKINNLNLLSLDDFQKLAMQDEIAIEGLDVIPDEVAKNNWITPSQDSQLDVTFKCGSESKNLKLGYAFDKKNKKYYITLLGSTFF